jgi:phage terminase Nu1 subunit (DNA packaging protein)
MAKQVSKKAGTQETGDLKGWQQIATFLGEPTSVVQRWAAQGMPVRRQGRYVTTTADELNQWLGRESGKPVHVATDSTDLTAELKRGISFVRRNHRRQAAEPAGESKKSTRNRGH